MTRAPKERGWLMKLFLGSDKPMDVMAQKFGIGPVRSGVPYLSVSRKSALAHTVGV